MQQASTGDGYPGHPVTPLSAGHTVRDIVPVTGVSRTRIYEVVQRIPRGKVATYGQIAILAGLRGHARQVGYALAALAAGSRVPWHRVINAKGCVSVRSAPGDDNRQRGLLEKERIQFDERGRVSLSRYQWRSQDLFDD